MTETTLPEPDYVALQASNLIPIGGGLSQHSHTSLEQAFDMARKHVNKTAQRAYIQRGLKRLAEVWMDLSYSGVRTARTMKMRVDNNNLSVKESHVLGRLAQKWRVVKWMH